MQEDGDSDQPCNRLVASKTLPCRDVEQVRLTQPAHRCEHGSQSLQRLLKPSRDILGNAGTAYLQSLCTLANKQGVGALSNQPASVTGCRIQSTGIEDLLAVIPSDRLCACHEFPPSQNGPAGFCDCRRDGHNHVMQGHRVGANLDLLIMTTSALHDLVNTTRALLLCGHIQRDTGEGALAHEGAQTGEIVRRNLKRDCIHVTVSILCTKV